MAGGGGGAVAKNVSYHNEEQWGEGGRGGGGGYSLVDCFGGLTVEHAFLSRRSTVPLLLVETPPTFAALRTFLPCSTQNNCCPSYILPL